MHRQLLIDRVGNCNWLVDPGTTVRRDLFSSWPDELLFFFFWVRLYTRVRFRPWRMRGQRLVSRTYAFASLLPSKCPRSIASNEPDDVMQPGHLGLIPTEVFILPSCREFLDREKTLLYPLHGATNSHSIFYCRFYYRFEVCTMVTRRNSVCA